VFVSSDTHRRATLDDEIVDADVRGERYRGFDVYGRTKLADLLVAAHLQRVFYAAHGTSISAAAHPGFSATGIVGNGFAGLPRFAHRVATAATGILGQPVAMGALPILYAATAADIGAARDVRALPYFGPTWLGELRGPPGQARQSSASRDPELMSMLVRRLEQYTGLEAPATIAE
jgi:protochlorophyllide reductase